MTDSPINTNHSLLARFLRQESAGGLLLFGAACLAVLWTNSPAAAWYHSLLDTPLAIQVGAFAIAKPLLLWVNDGLMAIFFFVVGLELKREFLAGELSEPSRIVLPAAGALGGMAAPALIYLYFNNGDPGGSNGWAIPTATDIAFSLGVLSLLGSRIPAALKLFLTTLAIIDDIGAIAIIAIFYTSDISPLALAVAACCAAVLFAMNRRHVCQTSPYLLVGLILWAALIKSGVHATLGGLALALFIPLRPKEAGQASPLKSLEVDLHPITAFAILPVFAFCNTGIDLRNLSMDQLLHHVPVGIALGLFVGKPLGVVVACWLSLKLGLARLPADISRGALLGVAFLCGIGFTMSLFIGSLAFESSGVNRLFDERLGIIVGSLASAAAGYGILRWVFRAPAPAQ